MGGVMDASEVAALIGCGRVVIDTFDHGTKVGVTAYWDESQRLALSHAVMEPMTGRRAHPSQPGQEELFPTREDFERIAARLREWRTLALAVAAKVEPAF